MTPRLAALLFALAAALALLFGSVNLGQAQIAASLLEVMGGGTQIGFDGERALGFATATSAGTGYDGWVVTKVELRIRPDDGTGTIRTATPPGLAICEATSSGDPDPNGTCYPLRAPGRVQIPAGITNGQEVTYRAPGPGHFLATDTEYTLHFTENGSTHANDVHHLDASNNDGEAVHVAGAFANIMRELRSDDTWGPSTSSVAWARITGYADATPVASEVNPNLPSLELVSSLGQNVATEEVALGTRRVVQGFTTGPHLHGYILDDIKVKLKNNSNSAVTTPVTMSLLTGSLSGNGGPLTGTLVASLTGPSTIPANSTANYSFTAATTVRLDGRETYDVLLEGGTTDIIVKLTASDNEDAAGQRGWSFGDFAYKMTAGLGTIFTEVDQSVLMSVNGAINPIPPRSLVSNVGQVSNDTPAIVDRAQPFRTGANPGGYTVKIIEIEIGAGLGTNPAQYPAITLRSGSATGALVGTPAKPSSSTDSGVLTYTFQTPVLLDASTTYWVVTGSATSLLSWHAAVSDVTDTATASGWTIPGKAQHKSGTSFVDTTGDSYLKFRVRGVPANYLARGAPRIAAPNVLRVPATLVVTLAGITDRNGATMIEDTAVYNWRRFPGSGGLVPEVASIGTGPTYTLTDADAGKRVSVQVWFIDDVGYSEGPQNRTTGAPVTAAARCAAPTLTGGAVFLEKDPVAVAVGYDSGPPPAYGYKSGSGVGNISVAPFSTITGGESRFLSIVTTGNTLVVGLQSALSATDQRTLVLHVCDQAYAFKSGTLSGSTYTFTSPSQNWSGHAERMVYLSQDTAVPTFVEARVNGTSLVLTFSEDLGAAASLANGAFTVKNGMGVTQSLSGTPSISGSTVTLTLATAVGNIDTGVKVAYTKPTTGTANKMVDKFDNEVATFPDQNVINELADSIPPALVASNAAVLARDGLTLTLTFNEALKTSSVPPATAFTVKATPAGSIEAEVALASSSAVTVSGSTVVLKLATPIAHNDGSANVSYAKPGTGAVIQDTNGNDAASFTNRPASNNSAVPRVSIRAVYPDTSPLIARPEFEFTRTNAGAQPLTLTLDMTQTESYFETTLVGTEFVSSETQVSSRVVYFDSPDVNMINTDGTLTITVIGGDDHLPALAPNNSATVQVKLPPTGPTIQVLHQQQAYRVGEDQGVVNVGVLFSAGVGVAQPRFNNITDVTIAVLTRAGTATINEDYQHISHNAAVGPSGWEPNQDGGYEFTRIVPITINDDNQYEGDETVQVYFDNTPGVSQLLTHSSDVATITITDDETLEVSSVEVSTTPTGGYYGFPGYFDVKATLNGEVNVTGTPRFAFELGGETRSAPYALGPSSTTELIFRYELVAADADDHDGISWGANAFSLNGGTIKFIHTDAAKQVNANLSHAAQGPLPGHKVDTTKPSLDEAEHDDTILGLTFTEDLNTAAPANTAFTVKVDGGTGTNPTAVSIAGEVVTLTLATAITSGQTVTVSYTKPSSNPIKDLSGKEADAFTDRNVDSASDIVNFRATPGNRRVALEWDNPGDSTIQRYQYRFMNTSDTTWNPDWRTISGSNANTTSFTATGLTNGIEYTFQVRPLFLQNQLLTMGKEGEIKSVPRGSLVAPRNLAAASAGDGELALSWNDPSDITITGYEYRHRNTSDSGWNPDWTDMSGSSATTTTHTLSGLTNFLLYTLEVRALRDGTAGPSARTTQKPRGPLTAPANFTAASGEDRRATLGWDNSGDDSITSFQYRYRVSSQSAWNPDWTAIPGSRWNTTSYTVRNLVNLTGYTFEARALRGALEGPASSATATPEGPPSVPLPPTALTVNTADRSLGLSWQPPVEEDARAPVTGYRVRYREQGRSWRNVSRGSQDTVLWQTISGLTNGRNYEVQVASANRIGTGAWTSAEGTPEAPEVGQAPPEPEGEEQFDVGRLAVWWDGTDPNGRNWGNERQMDSCAGTYSFTVIWAGPGEDRNAEEWAAHIATSGQANAPTYSFRRSPDTQEDDYEMNGRVRLDGEGYLSIRVRGRYGSSWGEWSPPAGLYCFENR